MTGKWIERKPSFLSFEVYNCNYCGKNVPRSIWMESIGVEDVPFCSPEVASVYVATRSHPDNQRRSDVKLTLTEELRVARAGCAALRDRTMPQPSESNVEDSP
jgi:hypothetical protein